MKTLSYSQLRWDQGSTRRSELIMDDDTLCMHRQLIGKERAFLQADPSIMLYIMSR